LHFFSGIFDQIIKIKSMKANMIGLNPEDKTTLVNSLNDLLSNYQIHYQNLRGLHWNIKGNNFFELHLKFEELYNDAQIKIDLIAERILTLEGHPLHTFKDYLNQSKIEVSKNVSKDVEAVTSVVSGIKTILDIERDILNFSGEVGDEGTNSMMSDFISEQEKTIWMLNAWLG
jgi:starvation-inducible DNA-binding protein